MIWNIGPENLVKVWQEWLKKDGWRSVLTDVTINGGAWSVGIEMLLALQQKPACKSLFLCT